MREFPSIKNLLSGIHKGDKGGQEYADGKANFRERDPK